MEQQHVGQRGSSDFDPINEMICQSVAEVVLSRLQEAAQVASVPALLLAAKQEADKKHGKATTAQVADQLKTLLNTLSAFVENTAILHDALREEGYM